MNYGQRNLSLVILSLALCIFSCNQDTFYEDGLTESFDDFPIDNEIDNEGETEDILTLYDVVNGQLRKVKDYDVRNGMKSYQADVDKHYQMWNFYKKLIPETHLNYIKQFEIFYGGDELAGYVVPIGDDISTWKTGLAIELANNLDDFSLSNEFTYTCIHEFGHILTLNEKQLEAGEDQCTSFQTYEGCSEEDSYINQLFQIGWKDIYAEHQQVDEVDIYDFYIKYQDRFVTDYAATNPGEDVAEVFTHFVINDNFPQGNTIADQKINAMVARQELLNIRMHMRNNPDVLSLNPSDPPKVKCRHHKKRSGKTAIYFERN